MARAQKLRRRGGGGGGAGRQRWLNAQSGRSCLSHLETLKKNSSVAISFQTAAETGEILPAATFPG